MQTIYAIKCEINDNGWNYVGDTLFENPVEALEYLRKKVAWHIRYLRRNHYDVDLLKVWSDRIIGTGKFFESQAITFRSRIDGIGFEYYDYRVFPVDLE